jgi:hypothetical protein
MAKDETDEQKLRCSFCDKSQDDVRKLVAGPAARICDECVEVCVDILADDTLQPSAGADETRQKYRTGSSGSSSDTRCTMCRMPLLLEEAVAVPNRALLCRPCVAEVQAAAAQASKGSDAPRGEP